MAKWKIDPDHSVAAFKVRHMMIAHVRGQFNKLSGAAEFDQADPSSFALEVVIETAGLYTGIVKRDAHLQSSDFFDVAIYPAISFKSNIFKGDAKGGRLSGDLTIHGITRPVTIDLIFSGPVKSPEDLGSEITLGITGIAKIDREEFDLTWNVPLEDGGLLVGKEISIALDLELDLEK